MQSHSQVQGSTQLPEGQALTTNLTQSEQDSYYSNQDIAVLHSVVAAAQHRLDNAPDPRPLPAAVLFKAYDDVLPDFGIDPDSDDHLSAFIFRIGGEQGHGTLSDKFQAILRRMGIVLEFGEDGTNSPRTSISSSNGSFPRNPGRRTHNVGSTLPRTDVPHDCEPPTAKGDVPWPLAAQPPNRRRSRHKASVVSPTRTSPTPSVASTYDNQGSGLHRSKNFQFPRTDVRIPPFVSCRASLVSVLDSWRNQAAAEVMRERRLGLAGGSEQDPTCSRDQESNQRLEMSRMTTDTRHLPAALRKQYSIYSVPAKSDRTHPKDQGLPHASPGVNVSGTAGVSIRTENHQLSDSPVVTERAVRPEQQARRLRRAARARQMYLASKVFNRWADRTALKLEREAVARRHMIRFRCFRGWSGVPGSKLPAADNLRATMAVQKLRRAVMQQKEQLRFTASAIASTYRVFLAQLVLEQWARRYTEHTLRHELAKRSKSIAVRDWKRLTWDNTESKRVLMMHTARCRVIETVEKWDWKAGENWRQLTAAQQVETGRLFFTNLGSWLSRAELKKRASAYRRGSLLEQIIMGFDMWNLRARAQAFYWKCEYLTVTTALSTWLERYIQDRFSSRTARRQHELLSRAKVARRVKQLDHVHTILTSLCGRARLYIDSKLLLEMFAKAFRARKMQMKGIIRKHLMSRYTHVSSKRRKRLFFLVLDHWRVTRSGAFNTAHVADIFRSTSGAAQCLVALSSWNGQAAIGQQALVDAQNYCRATCLKIWDERSVRQASLHAQAWRFWSLEHERLCFKAWSIAALQRSGQAHTAVVAQQRHSRESRSRVFQRWRAFARASKLGTLDATSASTARLQEFAGYRKRGASRAPPGGLESTKEVDYGTLPMETPTRWTGLPVPMTHALSSGLLSIVGEPEDESNTIPGSSKNTAQSKEPRQARVADLNLTAPTSTSTTPLALLPGQIERKIRTSSLGTGVLGRGGLRRPLRTWPDLQPVSPSNALAKSAEAVSTSVSDTRWGVKSRFLDLSVTRKTAELHHSRPPRLSHSLSVQTTAGRKTVEFSSSMPPLPGASSVTSGQGSVALQQRHS